MAIQGPPDDRSGSATQSGRRQRVLQLSLKALDESYFSAVEALLQYRWPRPNDPRLAFPLNGAGEAFGVADNRYVMTYGMSSREATEPREVYLEQRGSEGQPAVRVAWATLPLEVKILAARELPKLARLLEHASKRQTDEVAVEVDRLAALAPAIQLSSDVAKRRERSNEARLGAVWRSTVALLETSESAALVAGRGAPYIVREESSGVFGLQLGVYDGEIALRISQRSAAATSSEQSAPLLLPAAAFDTLQPSDQIRVAKLLPKLVGAVDRASDSVLHDVVGAIEALWVTAREASAQHGSQQAEAGALRTLMTSHWERVVNIFAQLQFCGTVTRDITAAGPAKERLHLLRRSGSQGPQVMLERGGRRCPFDELAIDEQLMVLDNVPSFWKQLEPDLSIVLDREVTGGPLDAQLNKLALDVDAKIEQLTTVRDDVLQRHYAAAWGKLSDLPPLLTGSTPSVVQETAQHVYSFAFEVDHQPPVPVISRRDVATDTVVDVSFDALDTDSKAAVLRQLPRHCAEVLARSQRIVELAEQKTRQLAMFERQIRREASDWSDRASPQRRRLDGQLRAICQQLMTSGPQISASVAILLPDGAAGWNEQRAPVLAIAAEAAASLDQLTLVYGVHDGKWGLSLRTSHQPARCLPVGDPATFPLPFVLSLAAAFEALFETLGQRHRAQKREMDAIVKNDLDLNAAKRQSTLEEGMRAFDDQLASIAASLLAAGFGLAAEVDLSDDHGAPWTWEGIVERDDPAAPVAGVVTRSTLAHRLSDGVWSLQIVQRFTQGERAMSLTRPEKLSLGIKLTLARALPALARRLEVGLQREIEFVHNPRLLAALIGLRAIEAELYRADLLKPAQRHGQPWPPEVAVRTSARSFEGLRYLGKFAASGTEVGTFVSLREVEGRLLPVLLRRDQHEEHQWWLSPLSPYEDGVRQALRQLSAMVGEGARAEAQRRHDEVQQQWPELTAAVAQIDELSTDALIDARDHLQRWDWPLVVKTEISLNARLTADNDRFALHYDGRRGALELLRISPEGRRQRILLADADIEVRLAALRAFAELSDRLDEAAKARRIQLDEASRLMQNSLKQLGLVSEDAAQRSTA